MYKANRPLPARRWQMCSVVGLVMMAVEWSQFADGAESPAAEVVSLIRVRAEAVTDWRTDAIAAAVAVDKDGSLPIGDNYAELRTKMPDAICDRNRQPMYTQAAIEALATALTARGVSAAVVEKIKAAFIRANRDEYRLRGVWRKSAGLMREVVLLRRRITKLETSLKACIAAYDAGKTEGLNLNTQVADLTERLSSVSAELDEVKAVNTTLASENAALKEDVANLTARIAELTGGDIVVPEAQPVSDEFSMD